MKIKIKGSSYLYKKYPQAESPTDGLCDTEKKIIYLGNKAKEETTIHEELHGVFWEAGMHDLDTYLEHAIIENVREYIEANFRRIKKVKF